MTRRLLIAAGALALVAGLRSLRRRSQRAFMNWAKFTRFCHFQRQP